MWSLRTVRSARAFIVGPRRAASKVSRARGSIVRIIASDPLKYTDHWRIVVLAVGISLLTAADSRLSGEPQEIGRAHV